MSDFTLTSSAFADGQPIPRPHTCEGEELSPDLAWTGPPEGSRSLALILDDADAPRGTFTHSLAWGPAPGASGLAEGEPAPVEGRNDSGRRATAALVSLPATGRTATSRTSLAERIAATGFDLHELDDLIGCGCPPATAYRILRP